MRNTIRNVTMVVPVLMTSCQVSEKWNAGPLSAHTSTIRSADRKVHGVPTACAVVVDAAWRRMPARPAPDRLGHAARQVEPVVGQLVPVLRHLDQAPPLG